MMPCSQTFRPLGRTGLALPPIVFGTSGLGNLYEVVPEETKGRLVAEIARRSPTPVVFDSAGKYGAGLALEALGRALRAENMPAERVVISNKLGWYRVPLAGPEPTFERGVWKEITHDAEQRVSYAGIRECYEQGRELLGPGYATQLVSVHDPDEYLAAATTAGERDRRFANILDAYRALFELKAGGEVLAVGVGAKDWRVIREIATRAPLDWVMLACSLTVYSHPPELLAFIADLHGRGVGILNSAVFHAGFLTGGKWFDYRQPDPVAEAGLFRWRDAFFAACRDFAVKPADACVQFGLAVPGIAAVALNTQKPERIAGNIASATAPIPAEFWRALQERGLTKTRTPGEGAGG